MPAFTATGSKVSNSGSGNLRTAQRASGNVLAKEISRIKQPTQYYTEVSTQQPDYMNNSVVPDLIKKGYEVVKSGSGYIVQSKPEEYYENTIREGSKGSIIRHKVYLDSQGRVLKVERQSIQTYDYSKRTGYYKRPFTAEITTYNPETGEVIDSKIWKTERERNSPEQKIVLDKSIKDGVKIDYYNTLKSTYYTPYRQAEEARVQAKTQIATTPTQTTFKTIAPKEKTAGDIIREARTKKLNLQETQMLALQTPQASKVEQRLQSEKYVTISRKVSQELPQEKPKENKYLAPAKSPFLYMKETVQGKDVLKEYAVGGIPSYAFNPDILTPGTFQTTSTYTFQEVRPNEANVFYKNKILNKLLTKNEDKNVASFITSKIPNSVYYPPVAKKSIAALNLASKNIELWGKYVYTPYVLPAQEFIGRKVEESAQGYKDTIYTPSSPLYKFDVLVEKKKQEELKRLKNKPLLAAGVNLIQPPFKTVGSAAKNVGRILIQYPGVVGTALFAGEIALRPTKTVGGVAGYVYQGLKNPETTVQTELELYAFKKAEGKKETKKTKEKTRAETVAKEVKQKVVVVNVAKIPIVGSVALAAKKVVTTLSKDRTLEVSRPREYFRPRTIKLPEIKDYVQVKFTKEPKEKTKWIILNKPKVKTLVVNVAKIPIVGSVALAAKKVVTTLSKDRTLEVSRPREYFRPRTIKLPEIKDYVQVKFTKEPTNKKATWAILNKPKINIILEKKVDKPLVYKIPFITVKSLAEFNKPKTKLSSIPKKAEKLTFIEDLQQNDRLKLVEFFKQTEKLKVKTKAAEVQEQIKQGLNRYVPQKKTYKFDYDSLKDIFDIKDIDKPNKKKSKPFKFPEEKKTTYVKKEEPERIYTDGQVLEVLPQKTMLSNMLKFEKVNFVTGEPLKKKKRVISYQETVLLGSMSQKKEVFKGISLNTKSFEKYGLKKESIADRQFVLPQLRYKYGLTQSMNQSLIQNKKVSQKESQILSQTFKINQESKSKQEQTLEQIFKQTQRQRQRQETEYKVSQNVTQRLTQTQIQNNRQRFEQFYKLESIYRTPQPPRIPTKEEPKKKSINKQPLLYLSEAKRRFNVGKIKEFKLFNKRRRK